MKIDNLGCGCITWTTQGITTTLKECGKCDYSKWAEEKREEWRRKMAEDHAYEEIGKLIHP